MNEIARLCWITVDGDDFGVHSCTAIQRDRTETREIYDLWLVPSISDIRHSYVYEMMKKKKSAQHDGHTLLLYHYVSYLTFTRSI